MYCSHTQTAAGRNPNRNWTLYTKNNTLTCRYHQNLASSKSIKLTKALFCLSVIKTNIQLLLQTCLNWLGPLNLPTDIFFSSVEPWHLAIKKKKKKIQGIGNCTLLKATKNINLDSCSVNMKFATSKVKKASVATGWILSYYYFYHLVSAGLYVSSLY